MKLRLLWLLPALLILPLLYVVARPQAEPPRVAFASPGKPAVVPFLLRSNHILVRGTVGDSDSLWFIVDSGAGEHVIGKSTASRLGLAVEGGVRALGSGGTEEAGMTHGMRFRLAGLELGGPFVAVIPLDRIATQMGQACDGVIGFPLFDHAVVTIDYANSVLRVGPVEGFEYQGRGTALPLTFTEHHPYIEASVTLPGGKPIPGRYVLDTGSSMALSLSPSFVEHNHALETMPRTIRARMGGVGGATYSPIGRVERLDLGPYPVQGPVTSLRPAGPGRIVAENAAGNIGGEILRRFAVTFDYSRRQVILEPGPTLGDPFEADMSGLTFQVRDDSTRALEVLWVQPDSPAAEQGIAAGDVVATVDSRPVDGRGIAELQEGLRMDGRTVRLGVQRNGKLFERTLTLRRLI